MTIVLEQGATAGAVHHDEIGGIHECRDVAGRERLCAMRVARMLVQRATADLSARFDDAIAVGLERAPRRIVHVREQAIHHAATKECDRRARGRRRD